MRVECVTYKGLVAEVLGEGTAVQMRARVGSLLGEGLWVMESY